MRVQSINFTNPYNNKSINNRVPFDAKPKFPFSKQKQSELMVFFNHIYEFKKGVRNLILTTEKKSNEAYIEARLKKEKIPYLITPAGENTINVFFGKEECIKVVSTFDTHLNKLSPEKDFMLGIMLGYDRVMQCSRYLQRLTKK